MRATIIYSSQDIAGVNIAKKLVSDYSFQQASSVNDFPAFKNGGTLLVEIPSRTVHSENLSLPGDYYIFASRHASETGRPCFTVHPIGNWGKAELGGREKTIVTAFASKMKVALLELNRLAGLNNFTGRLVCFEVTHHGPFLEKPTLFVEVGSSEREWVEERACSVVAGAIMKTVDSNEEFDAFFGAGGGHYSPTFTKIGLLSEFSFGHMIPKHAVGNLEQEVFAQAIEKNVEQISTLLFDWKGLVVEQREKLMGFCKEFGIDWEKGK
ncbi:hypothetical protein HY992_01000 [Candidatus Micrarchaeota archaeon]|nr:hypothetical protein [Candidatus Micrarchaeota archaeon]